MFIILVDRLSFEICNFLAYWSNGSDLEFDFDFYEWLFQKWTNVLNWWFIFAAKSFLLDIIILYILVFKIYIFFQLIDQMG